MSTVDTPTRPDPLAVFTELSVALTGFDRVELAGTGLIEQHYDTVLRLIGEREAGHLFQAAADALDADRGDPEGTALRTQVVENKRYGPVIINLIKLWYLGSWYPLPGSYADVNGSTADDVEHVVSAQAYREGLVWIAAGAHPMGAKAPGFGSWAEPPTIVVL
ncbi:hypothetical protein GCM10009839_54250 [Catenulispora yoronensis]|uniref:Uncharacterized protein n=1 Tax=Catenulispora yoronensis TaxID=450799 RepID=A0ABP5GF41_9ACTN